MELLEMMDAPTRVDQTIRLRIRLDDLEHVAPELLERFAAGSATPPERRAVVRHLLARCPSCSRRLGRLVPLEPPQEMAASYDEAFDRSLDHAFEALKRWHAELDH